MRRIALSLGVWLLAGLVQTAGVSIGRPVRVTVAVNDARTGEPVSGLSLADFDVRSDAVSAPILSASPDTRPLFMGLLFDATWATAIAMAPFVVDPVPPNPPSLAEVISGWRPPDRPGELFTWALTNQVFPLMATDLRICVGAIGREVRLTSAFTGSRSELRAGLPAVFRVSDRDRHGSTPLWDAVDKTVSLLEGEAGQRAIVLVTAGFATGNRKSLTEVSRRAALSGVAVYVVQEALGVHPPTFRLVDQTNNPWMLLGSLVGDPPETALRSLAGTTGGMHFLDKSIVQVLRDSSMAHASVVTSSNRANTLATFLARIMNDVRHRYSIEFDPPVRDAAMHALETRVRGRYTVRGPQIYRRGVF